jgi:hypothetical protein
MPATAVESFFFCFGAALLGFLLLNKCAALGGFDNNVNALIFHSERRSRMLPSKDVLAKSNQRHVATAAAVQLLQLQLQL